MVWIPPLLTGAQSWFPKVAILPRLWRRYLAESEATAKAVEAAKVKAGARGEGAAVCGAKVRVAVDGGFGRRGRRSPGPHGRRCRQRRWRCSRFQGVPKLGAVSLKSGFSRLSDIACVLFSQRELCNRDALSLALMLACIFFIFFCVDASSARGPAWPCGRNLVGRIRQSAALPDPLSNSSRQHVAQGPGAGQRLVGNGRTGRQDGR